jgi:hypothetical protein
MSTRERGNHFLGIIFLSLLLNTTNDYAVEYSTLRVRIKDYPKIENLNYCVYDVVDMQTTLVNNYYGTQEVFLACDNGDSNGKAYAYTSDCDLMWSKGGQGDSGNPPSVSDLGGKWTLQIGIGYWYSSSYLLKSCIGLNDVYLEKGFYRSYTAELEYRILNSIKAIFNIEYGKWQQVHILPSMPYMGKPEELADNFFRILNIRLGSSWDFFKSKKLRISGGVGVSGARSWQQIGGKYFGNYVVNLPTKMGWSFTAYVEKRTSRNFVMQIGVFLHYDGYRKTEGFFRRRGVNLKIGFVL